MACEDDVLELMDQLAAQPTDEQCLEFFEANEAMGEKIVRLERDLTNLQAKVSDRDWLLRRARYLLEESLRGNS